MKIKCKELREIMYTEWQRFQSYTPKQVEGWIRYNFECTEYTVKTLAKEFAGRK